MVEWVQASTRWTAFICLVILACYSSRYVNETTLQWFFGILQGNPHAGLALFVAFSIVAVVLMLPGMLVAVATGALYGAGLGFLLNWATTAIGQSLAFLLGRYLLRDVVTSWLVTRFHKFSMIESAICKEDWKLVLLLRLSPLIPYNVLNYLLSLTSISFWPYAVASSVGIVPYTFVFVYLGSLSGDVSAALSGGLFGPDVPQWKLAWIAASLLLTLVTGVLVAVISKQTLRAALMTESDDSSDEESCMLHGSLPGERQVLSGS